MFYGEPQTLIVVYKDEMIVNQLKKMVETKDDTNESNIIGTTDGSIRIVSWSEKVWLDQKKAGNVSNKVLFIGDIKGTEKLVPIIDIQFEEYGVKYGWAGNQAVVSVEPKAVKEKAVYEEFLSKVSAMPVPEIVKKNYYIDFNKKEDENFFKNAFSFVKKAAKEVGTVFTDNADIKRQMLFYGVINLYNKHLEQFVNL